jgi:hypothetical protein
LPSVLHQEELAGVLRIGYLRLGGLIAFAVVAVAAILLARRFRDHPLGRRPLLAQHLFGIGLIALAASHLLHGIAQVALWSFTAVFLAYFWYLAYALMDQRQRQPASLMLQFASLHGFFAPQSAAPMGRGAATWRSVEARTADELAVTQLKAIKLLVWALILKVVLWVFRRVVYGKLNIVALGPAFEVFLREGTVPPLGTLSVVANFPEQLLSMAIFGHAAIAVARLAGFRLLRNTCRPLSSRSIADFWNRYVYYFKEVLVNVYFYPVYLRWFKRHPRVRIAFATFMAAGVGNFFFHFILENQRIAAGGVLDALSRMQTYAFYCAALSFGIIVSQLRGDHPPASRVSPLRRATATFGVMVFYCFLSVFDGTNRHAALAQHFAFLFRITGVGRWIQMIG